MSIPRRDVSPIRGDHYVRLAYLYRLIQEGADDNAGLARRMGDEIGEPVAPRTVIRYRRELETRFGLQTKFDRTCGSHGAFVPVDPARKFPALTVLPEFEGVLLEGLLQSAGLPRDIAARARTGLRHARGADPTRACGAIYCVPPTEAPWWGFVRTWWEAQAEESIIRVHVADAGGAVVTHEVEPYGMVFGPDGRVWLDGWSRAVRGWTSFLPQTIRSVDRTLRRFDRSLRVWDPKARYHAQGDETNAA